MGFKLQDKIQKMRGIPGKYKRILTAIANRARNDGTNFFEAKETIGAKAGVDRSTAFRNMDELTEMGILPKADSHECGIDSCPKGAQHFYKPGNHWTQAYYIDLVALQKYDEWRCKMVREKKKSGVAKRTRVALQNATEVALHFEMQCRDKEEARSTGSDEPSVLTNGESKKESSLASLARQGADAPLAENQKQDSFGVSPKTEQNQPQEQPHRPISQRTSELNLVWENRTGYRFSEEDHLSADALIRAHGFAVVNEVLVNTIVTRERSRKLRWNNFQVFARNWERNYEEYRAYMSGKGFNKVAQRFNTPESDPKDINAVKEQFKTRQKLGDWELKGEELYDMGYKTHQIAETLQVIVADDIVVTKDEFMAILDQAAGIAPLAKAVAANSFDPEEA